MVERISTELSLEQFQNRYLRPNKPCVFSSTFTDKWRSRLEWVKDGKPDLKYLSENFGDCTIPVADCSKKHFNAHEKLEMNLKQFLDYWMHKISNPEEDEKLLYLKDWHFQRDFPNYRAYEVLEYFQSDWLNEWYDQNTAGKDDYRFVYMGPKDTWTSFHADVLRSYSWSANICGTKKWLLFPPGEEENLKDLNGHLPFDVKSEELTNKKLYPNSRKAAKPIEIIQEQGEIVFIPSCWHHQVYNLDHTISINHNWTNAYGINFVFQHLKAELLLVENEILEFKETEGWTEQCQLLLKCTAGLDYKQFTKMLNDLIEPRFDILRTFLRSKKGTDDSRGNKDDFCEEMKVALNRLKRVEISCVPGEHLKYDRETFSRHVDLPLKQEGIRSKMKNVLFDLEQLVETLQSVYCEMENKKVASQMNELTFDIKDVSSYLEEYRDFL